MKRAPPGLPALLEEATRLVSRAASRLLADPRGQEAVARAVGLAQRGLQRVEALQAEAMKAAGIPGRQDYQELTRQLARVKRKARQLASRLEARGAAEPPGEAPGRAGGASREPGAGAGAEGDADEGSGGARSS